MILPTKSGIPKGNREQDFTEQANDPSQWKLRASDLNYAADVLWEIAKPLGGWGRDPKAIHPADPKWVKLIHPIILLKGYAIENLLKAFYVKHKTELGQAIHEDDKLFNTHVSVHLCEMSNVSLSKEETHLIERLNRYVMWAARYPTPKNTNEDFVPSFITSELEIVDMLIGRLNNAWD